MLATEGTWREADSPGDWREVLRAAMIASLFLLLALGAFLCVRRLSGALDAPLPPAPLAATASILLLWALTLRVSFRFKASKWLPLVAIALFAIACSYPGARWFDWGIWLAVLGIYGFAPARRSSLAIAESHASDVMLQEISRSRTVDGDDVIQGTLVAEFAPGERSTTLHVAFCPPFEQLPQVDAEVIDGPECDLKITQVLHQGARIEARLSRASTATERVTVDFIATEHSEHRP